MINFQELRKVMRRVVYETIRELGLDLDGGIDDRAEGPGEILAPVRERLLSRLAFDTEHSCDQAQQAEKHERASRLRRWVLAREEAYLLCAQRAPNPPGRSLLVLVVDCRIAPHERQGACRP